MVFGSSFMTYSFLNSFLKYGLPLTRTNLKKIHYTSFIANNQAYLTPTMNSGHVTVTYVTAPNEDVARKLAKQLVENRLAACVNIVKTIESIFEWKGVIEHEQESMLIIKSHSKKTKDLIEFVEKNHPYDCPEVLAVKVDSGSKKYLEWVEETISKPSVARDEK